jgi:4-amino-4-deoxy-L-arabinose transferase-like glycosyltransferase
VTARPGPSAARERSPWAWLARPEGALLLILAWAGVHTFLRLSLSTALTADDAREAVLAQSLRWGYQARQPPLYNWLAWVAFRLIGPGLVALTLLKYLLLVLAFWLVYVTARRIVGDPRLATLGTFALLLLLPIGWTVHEALTHSVVVLATCAGTVYALVRIADEPSPLAYAGLGLAVGLGLLSKFTFVPFLAALGLAALTVERYRLRVLTPRILIAIVVAALLILPFAVWFVGEGHDLGRLYAREVRIENGHTWARSARAGLLYIVRITVLYLAPVGLALGACFPALYRPLPPESRDSPDASNGRLVGWLLVWMLVVFTVAALAGGLSFLKARWLVPTFFLAPVYGLWRAERQGVSSRRVTALAVLLALVEVAVIGGLAFRVVGASQFRQPYRMNEPYDAIATGLSRAGFTHGTIVAGYGTLAGNLAVRFTDSRILHTEYPDFQPAREDSGQCLLVWDRRPGRRGNPDEIGPPEDVRRYAEALDVALTGSEPVGVVETPFLFDARRIRRVHYILLPDGAGRCR